ncbi:MAG TPA: HAMP domain-containing sensor histidine kinase [Polyangiaceae bacterium]|nr:HAMP domain-containing sensor histidine kinase [Polyangiaceae bacterium]
MSVTRHSSLTRKLTALAVAQLLILVIVFVGVGWISRGVLPPELGGPYHAQGEVGAERPPRPHGVVTPVNTLLAGGLVILCLGSFLTARSIVTPLNVLARAAKALGDGNLATRSGIVRSDEIGELSRAFDDMAERIEQLVLTEKELLANVSHELRTPLARIRVALDIAEEAEGSNGSSPLAGIGADLQELERILDDILTTTRLEIASGTPRAARFELHTQTIHPEALCQSAAERFRTRHPRRPLDLVFEEALPCIEVDPVLFRRVLDNLLENAHKYSPDPAIRIGLRATRASHGDVGFAVEDRGIGIAQRDLPQLFTPFFRVDRSRTRGTGGVGLGLALAKRVVEAHGGTLCVESTFGRGTTFYASVPALGSFAGVGGRLCGAENAARSASR